MLTINDLIPAATINTVAAVGLHKIAGAMMGVDELTIKEAVTALGTKAYIRRKQASAIAEGAAALLTLSGTKVAGNEALLELLKRSVMPAVGGAAISTVPHLLSRDPNEQTLEAMLPSMGVGGLLGGMGGGMSALSKATRGGQGAALAGALRGH